MKKTLFALAVGVTTFSALATDGTFSASNVIGGVRQYIYDLDGVTKLAPANGAVQFVFNGAVVGAGTYNFISPGTFSAGTVGIPNQAGNTIQLTVDVWDKSIGGSTFEQAVLSGAYISETVTITLGGAGSPPATAAALTGFIGGPLRPMPEPSTVALAVLGLGGLLVVSRRK